MVKSEVNWKSPQGTFSITWDKQSSLVMVQLQGDAPDEIDAFYNAVCILINEWPSDTPYLMMNDARDLPNHRMSPRLRHRLHDFIQLIPPTLDGKLATVLHKNATIIMTKLLIEIYIDQQRPNLATKLFFGEDDARSWLKTP